MIYIAAYFLVEFYYGIHYSKVLVFLAVMLIQLWLSTVRSIVGCSLLSINKEHYNLFVKIVFLLIKCILSYYFIIEYGIMGFIYAKVLAEIPAIPMEYLAARRAFVKEFGYKIFS